MPQPLPLAPRLSLADGAIIPQLGYGLYKVPAQDATRLSLDAIALGYRHLDTAAFYGNEREVGEAVRAAPMPREELFVTSKVWKDKAWRSLSLRTKPETIE